MAEPDVLLDAAAAAAAAAGMTSNTVVACIDKDQDEKAPMNNSGEKEVLNGVEKTVTSSSSSPSMATSSALSKTDKRRLKKLQKKASLHIVDASLSGILLPQDWKDLLRLQLHHHQQAAVPNDGTSQYGPRIQWRVSKRTNHTGCLTKGAHHRDLLYKLLYQQQQQQQQQQQEKNNPSKKVEGNCKKRPRSDATEENGESNDEEDGKVDAVEGDGASADWSWPEWATIHNPIAVEHMAVLQVHVDTRDELQQLTQLVEKEAAGRVAATTTSDSSTTSSPFVVLSTPTEWFKKSGKNSSRDVKSISDVLLYSKPKDKKMSKKQKHDINMAVQTTTDLVAALQDLILTRLELQEEHYPLAVDDDEEDDYEEEDTTTDKKMAAVDDDPTLLCTETSATEQQEVVPPPAEAASTTEQRHPSDWSLDEAKAAIQPYQVIRKRKSNSNSESKTIDGSGSSTSFPPWIMIKKKDGPMNNDKDVPSTQPRIWALDCEMVETTAGRELARITLVQVKSYSNLHNDVKNKSNLETCVVLDTLVRPKHVVTDYLTQYSGVSASDFVVASTDNEHNKDQQKVVVELEQVHAFLVNVISHDDIVVGHSLENDFWACRWIHTTCVDTAILFRRLRNSNSNNKRFMKHSLRHLAQHLLHKQIQRGSHHSNGAAGGGHCSEEDATTALELAVRRAVEGPTFGSAIGVGNHNQEMSQWPNFCHVGKTVAIGPVTWLNRHVTSIPSAVHALNCEGVQDSNRKAVTSWLTINSSNTANGGGGSNTSNGKTDRRAKLVWSHWDLSSTSSLSSSTSASKKNDSENNSKLASFMELVVKDLLQKVQASNDTLVLIAFQCGYSQVVEQQEQRRIKQDSRTTSNWTNQDEERLVALVEDCRIGNAIWIGFDLGIEFFIYPVFYEYDLVTVDGILRQVFYRLVVGLVYYPCAAGLKAFAYLKWRGEFQGLDDLRQDMVKDEDAGTNRDDDQIETMFVRLEDAGTSRDDYQIETV